MNTVMFVQFSPSWLQNARGKFVLQAQIVKGCEFAGIKIMMIITKQCPSIGIIPILSSVLAIRVFVTAVHSELHFFICHSWHESLEWLWRII